MAAKFDPALRASAALNHLQGLLGTASGHLVIMLQEDVQESLLAILDNPWVQDNFIVTNSVGPESIYDELQGDDFVCKDLYWRAVSYFTLMIPKSLAVSNCFCVSFVSIMGRDALFVDLPISNGEQIEPNKTLRLCTTHLESLGCANDRSGQLAMISALPKGPQVLDSGIIAGLVGGDINAGDRSEHDLHKTSDVGLKDVWEDISAPPPPVLRPFQRDVTLGRARGNTWGYQSDRTGNRKRLDKFFYTGQLETVALTEPHDVTRRLGRIRIELKTEAETWEGEIREEIFVRNRLVPRVCKVYFSPE